MKLVPISSGMTTVLAASDAFWLAFFGMITTVVTSIVGLGLTYLKLHFQMKRLERQATAPRRIGARKGEDAPVILPPDDPDQIQ